MDFLVFLFIVPKISKTLLLSQPQRAYGFVLYTYLAFIPASPYSLLLVFHVQRLIHTPLLLTTLDTSQLTIKYCYHYYIECHA